ncbi:eukaryotic translation initiation factor 5B-like isoform X1 [Mangifera indica]|uniref:eukaryotic translation initiation factor 5B-like isoform X1 n=1 Tax=Mangifera indica TaxID=29780 RepID=UPI001CFBBD5D|nr:eukaryotic translation initiation factor 5B-like isoform X1 [Mangifera indica]
MGSNERKQKKVKPKKKSKLELSENEEMINPVEEETEKSIPSIKKKRKRDKGNTVDVKMQDHSVKEIGGEKRYKTKKKIPKSGNASNYKFGQLGAEDEDGINKLNVGNSKKAKKKEKDHDALKNDEVLMEKSKEADQNEVYFISSGDDDSSKGMKKWLTEYHQSRPGLKVLQQRIDEFITAHEAKLEQERKEREALAAEGGWTVVVHHKGRKKTTDSESGTTVGSVAQAAVEDKLAKKKKKEVGLDFYRFQRREAQRNEIMMLQSKFEQDRKRIQQLRAARKFRPY